MKAIVEAHKMPNSTMYGVGITPEGINQNYVMYEFALERGWDHTTVDADKWFDHYAFTRYGESDEFVKSAWDNLRVSFCRFISILKNSYLKYSSLDKCIRI